MGKGSQRGHGVPPMGDPDPGREVPALEGQHGAGPLGGHGEKEGEPGSVSDPGSWTLAPAWRRRFPRGWGLWRPQGCRSR